MPIELPVGRTPTRCTHRTHIELLVSLGTTCVLYNVVVQETGPARPADYTVKGT